MSIISKICFTNTVTLKWLSSYFVNLFRKEDRKPYHIFFCLLDHYEPGTGNVSRETELERVEELLEKYPRLVKNHKDFYGNTPKRTWFFPPHYHRNYNLKKLVSLCENGYGEIELHLHHGKTRPDTYQNLKNTILKCIEEYSLFGIFGQKDGKKKYGFIHGDWALDNSRGGKYCGVNNELIVLKETGCYADFTHPSMIETNPSLVNSIYYASDDPNKPKSYKSGEKVRKHGNEVGDLMLIQGPLYPFFISNKPWSLRTMGDAINGDPPVNERRIDTWVRTNICVQGKNDFIFIKTHTHGATDNKAVLGLEIEKIFSYLEWKYNDGRNYILHYVTARELYNIVKAIEAGENTSNPEEYRNYYVDKPFYDSSVDISEASDILRQLVSVTYKS
jgi:hypothetical protein